MTHLHLEQTRVKDCVVFDLPAFEDVRGSFLETYNFLHFHLAGLPTDWPQDNVSTSRDRVLRGLHIQRYRPQGKLVRCLRGVVWDVCLDLREDSPTFLGWHGETLKAGKTIYCPPGTAHGFVALEAESIVYYKCTSLYDFDSDGGLNALDPFLGIQWPHLDFVMSDKDKALPSLREWLKDPRGLRGY